MKGFWILTALAISGIAPMAAQTVKVGTFHKASIVVAYYRSPMWADLLKPKMAELAEAKKANDNKKAAELENWGKTHQETAHQQLTGEAPITNILESLQTAFPEIARTAHVELIVADVLYASSAVEIVDVTDRLLDWLKADETTRKIVAEIQKHKGPSPPLH